MRDSMASLCPENLDPCPWTSRCPSYPIVMQGSQQGRSKKKLATVPFKKRPELRWVSDRPGAPVDHSLNLSSIQDLSLLGLNTEIEFLCKIGRSGEVLNLLPCTGSALSHDAYWLLLRLCHKEKSLSQAKLIYQHLCAYQKDISTSIHEYYITILISCGDLLAAVQAFNFLPCKTKTVFLWTAVISGYVNCNQGAEALRLYRRMRDAKVQPNEYTFVSLLKACTSIGDLYQGRALHMDVQRSGFISNLYIASALVTLYGKCSSIVDAEKVFALFSEQQSTIIWTAMLSAYVNQGYGKQALQLYKQMQDQCVSVDERIFVVVLQACSLLLQRDGGSSNIMAFDIGQALHADARKKGFHMNAYVTNSLINMYGKCSSIVEAENVFKTSHHRDVVSWNGLLTVYVELGETAKAFKLYKQMQEEGVSSNERTFVILLQACCLREAFMFEDQAVQVQIGRALHVDVKRRAFHLDVFIGSALVNMYSKCKSIIEAETVFSSLPKHNVVLWNTMMSAYVEGRQGQKALDLYGRMQEEGANVDEVTFVLVLRASSQRKNLEICRQAHFNAVFAGYEQELLTANNLILAYGNCGCIPDCQAVFDALSWHNAASWNALLSVYAGEGNRQACLHYYKKMQYAGVKPDEITLASLRSVCSPSYLVQQGVEW